MYINLWYYGCWKRQIRVGTELLTMESVPDISLLYPRTLRGTRYLVCVFLISMIHHIHLCFMSSFYRNACRANKKSCSPNASNFQNFFVRFRTSSSLVGCLSDLRASSILFMSLSFGMK